MRHNQSRRSRGRSRKGPNPLTRSYESNGPDVKVRGTAAHVAEKYMSLARDAVASGDSVSAENYLQHAEHYNRIVMAAQAQFQQQPPQPREGGEDGYEDDRFSSGRSRDRFDHNGDGRSDGEGDEGYDGPEGEEDRGYRQARRPDDQSRQRSPRPDRYESPERAGGERPQEAVDPANEPQPDVPEPATAEAAEAVEAPAPSKTRRRRRAPKADNDDAEAQGDSTKDGAAALAAFPE